MATAGGATNAQPQVWTFLDFEAPDERAEELAEALAAALDTVTGWWADFIVGEEHVVVFANRVFRYRIGDHKGRDEAVAWDVPLGPPSTSSTGANSSFRRLGETGTSGPGRPPAQRSSYDAPRGSPPRPAFRRPPARIPVELRHWTSDRSHRGRSGRFSWFPERPQR
jgi:hypothetical protein